MESVIGSNENTGIPLEALLSHPIFWPMKDILEFIKAFSDLMAGKENQQKYTTVVDRLKENFTEIKREKSSWLEWLSPEVKVDCHNPKGRRPYNGNDILELIRVIRNTKDHYQELPEKVQNELESSAPDEFANYWFSRFPKLVPILYIVAQELITNEKSLEAYFVKGWTFESEHQDVGRVLEALQREEEIKLFPDYFLRSYILKRNRGSGVIIEQKITFLAKPHGILPFVLQNETSTLIATVNNLVSVQKVHHHGGHQATTPLLIPIEESHNQRSNLIVITDNILEFMQNEIKHVSHDSSIVIFTNLNSFGIQKIIMGKYDGCDISEVPMKWLNLDQEYQEKLLDKIITFQNAELTLREVCNDPSILQYLPGEFIQRLKYDKKPELLKWDAPILPSYYIDRFLIPRKTFSIKAIIQVMNRSSFQINDRFVVMNVAESKFKSIFDKGITAVGAKDPDKFLNKFRFIEGDDAKIIPPERMCNTHFIRYSEDSGRFEWVKSTGSLDLIQQVAQTIRNSDDKNAIPEQNFLDTLASTKEDTIIVADSPGMGKSTLFHSMTNMLIKKYPTRIVRLIKVTAFSEKLNVKTASPQVGEEIFKFILPEITTCDFVDKFARFKLGPVQESKEFNCEFLFDGFDELQADRIGPVLNALTSFKNFTNNTRIWLSTRPHYQEMVEANFTVMGYAIKGLSENDQINFLASFWNRSLDSSIDNLHLQKCAIECVKSYTPGLLKITGIPLQCLLLAEIHEKTVMSLTQDNLSEFDWGKQRIRNDLELYRKTMERKLQIFLEKQSFHRAVPNSYLEEYASSRMKKIHMEIALKCLVSKKWVGFFSKTYFWPEGKVKLKEIMAYGIMTKFNKKPNGFNFLHGTFADYFVALFVYEMMTFDGMPCYLNKDICEFIVEEIFKLVSVPDQADRGRKGVIFRNEMVLYFLCEIISEKKIPKNNYFYSSFCTYITEHDKNFDYVYLLVSTAMYPFQDTPKFQIVKLVLESLKAKQQLKNFIKVRDSKDIRSLLSSATYFEKMPDFKYFCETLEAEKVDLSSVAVNLGPLRNAIRLGNLEMVKYLTVEHRFGKSIWFQNYQQDPLLSTSFLFIDDHNSTEACLNKYGPIMKYLVSLDKNILEMKDQSGHTILLETTGVAGFHQFARFLISLGCDTNVTDSEGNTAIHLYAQRARGLHTDRNQFHELLVSFIQNGYEVNKKNDGGKTILHPMLMAFEPLPKTLLLLQKSGFDFKKASRDEHNILITAVEYGHGNVNFVKSLVEFGCDNFYEHSSNKSPATIATSVLHTLAVFGNLGALKYFVETHNLDVNMKVDNGNTPIHSAFMYCGGCELSAQFQVVQYLISKGAQVTELNSEGKSVLDIGLANGLGAWGKRFNLETLKLLEENGFELSETRCTKMLVQIASNEIDYLNPHPPISVAHYLREKGADVNYQTEGGESLLHLSCNGCWEDGVKWLVEECGFQEASKLNAVNKQGQTPLQTMYQFYSKRPFDKHNQDSITRYLVEKGADVTSVKTDFEASCTCQKCSNLDVIAVKNENK